MDSPISHAPECIIVNGGLMAYLIKATMVSNIILTKDINYDFFDLRYNFFSKKTVLAVYARK
jgi:hypothetical protein